MIRIVGERIDRETVIQSVASPDCGAIATFDGTIRNHAQGKAITHLHYDVYTKMAAKEMEKIRQEAMRRWSLHDLAIVHRSGRVEIGESSVLIAVSAPHRKDALEACRFAIDALKVSVPIWKKEFFEDGEVWVEGQGG